MLRGLGVLDVGHGRRTRVCEMGASTLGQLVPLMMMSGGQTMFEQVFEVRLALESMSARLAAGRRTEMHVARLQEGGRSLSSAGRARKRRGLDNGSRFPCGSSAGERQSPFPGPSRSALRVHRLHAAGKLPRRHHSHSTRDRLAHGAIAAAIAAKDGGWAAAGDGEAISSSAAPAAPSVSLPFPRANHRRIKLPT